MHNQNGGSNNLRFYTRPNKRWQLLFILLLLFPALFSCRNYSSEAESDTDNKIRPYYAKGFSIENDKNLRILRVYSPWQGAGNILFTYLLADSNKELPENLPEGLLIRTPVQSVVCMSTSHIAMIDFINKTDKISAISGKDYIFNPKIRERIEETGLPDVGYEMNTDLEMILELSPDVVIAYSIDAAGTTWINRLKNLGIPVIIAGEYLENSPLAQAEWAIFIASLFNKEDMATEKFSTVEREYKKLKALTSDISPRPVVMSGLPWRGSWFVPGGESHFATLIKDAGGDYIWGNNRKRENYPVDFERIMDEGANADFWINIGTAASKRDIINNDYRLGVLNPFRNNNLYNNNARLNRYGGNDYWESGIVTPHLILKDLISIIHPELIEEHNLYYYRKIE